MIHPVDPSLIIDAPKFWAPSGWKHGKRMTKRMASLIGSYALSDTAHFDRANLDTRTIFVGISTYRNWLVGKTTYMIEWCGWFLFRVGATSFVLIFTSKLGFFSLFL